MPSQPALVRFASIALLLSSVSGCGGTAKQVNVWGNVSYRSAPITRGTLTFFPAGGRPVTAVIDRDGAYSCELVPGRYVATVTIGVDLPAGWKEGDPLPRPALILPPQYGSRKKTPLAADVAAGQSEAVDFLLQ